MPRIDDNTTTRQHDRTQPVQPQRAQSKEHKVSQRPVTRNTTTRQHEGTTTCNTQLFQTQRAQSNEHQVSPGNPAIIRVIPNAI